MLGISNCCWQLKDLLGIVGEPTLQHEFVSQLQKRRQSTSCLHLWENLWGPDRDESTSDVMWKFASTVWRLGARVHGHHSRNDRSGALRRVLGQDGAENA